MKDQNMNDPRKLIYGYEDLDQDEKQRVDMLLGESPKLRDRLAALKKLEIACV